MTDLDQLLHATFGFPAFRPNQQAVCRVVTDGRDALLVMPTGAGKSLCYQLPAIARHSAGEASAALVVSPLISLMDDQAAKLTAHGLRVGRIHSGRSRDDARLACRDYLDGTLDFLFIAPERMRVPGFPEMLARRKPSLIAIDEAHCISAWGHDFRPDYRTLGEHLPALRPAPIIALTATATPMVQQDIVAQLHLNDPALFIHGFRRTNLAIEAVEMSRPRRHEFTARLLQNPAARPAIVYTPSRRDAEELAAQLAVHFSAAAYHAGLDSSIRERVQRDFQSGKLEVVVATIAFGMGIDKADVRTIVHTALPASVEAFYQEIGRAGRDGLPSRAVLLHGYADRKIHESFLERDYPPADDLTRVAAVLTDDFLLPAPLAQRLKMDLGSFTKAIEKLVAQGASAIDFAGNVRRAGPISQSGAWRAGYEAQIAFRRSQIDRMVAFAETRQCRMTALIRHFGDIADAHHPCGLCDFCSPTTTTAQSYRPATQEELRQFAAILHELGDTPRHATSTGKLYTSFADGPLRATPAVQDRKLFDTLLDALARAALITLASDTFTNSEGNVIPYKKAALTHEGREAATTGTLHAPDLLLPDIPTDESSTSKLSRGLRTRSSKAARKAEREQAIAAFTPAQKQLDEYLRAWRKSEAAKTGKPAFIVFGDAVIRNIVFANPQTISELLAVSGIGPNKADQFGAAIVAICRTNGSANSVNAITTSAAVTPHRIVPTEWPKARNMPAQMPAQDKGVATLSENPSSAEGASRLPHSMRVKNKKTTKHKHDHRLTEYENRRLDLKIDLRELLKDQSKLLKISVSNLLSEEAMKEIFSLQPKTEIELARLPNLRGDLPFTFYKALLETCNATYIPEPEPTKMPHRMVTEIAPVKERSSPVQQFGEPTPTFHRERPTAPADPTAALTPDQQQLDASLRAWRKSEAERIGLPQFFVLGSSALRSIVLLRPRTLTQLQTISGIGPDKAEKFGSAILALCNA